MPLEANRKPTGELNALGATQVAKSDLNSPTPLRMALNAILDLKVDYLRCSDPTEYKFAVKFAGGWERWKTLSDNPELAPMIGQWREELAQKLSSEALSRILEAAQGETRDALSANKYIYEALGKSEIKGSVGRPSLEKIQKEARKLLDDERIKDEAYTRIFNKD